jgi:hypothetical protein
MPNFDTHKKVGYFVAMILGVVFIFILKRSIPISVEDWRVLLIPAVIYVYSNLPDMDHHMGRLRRHAFKMVFMTLSVSIILYYILGPDKLLFILTIIGVIGYFLFRLKHRGFLHTYLFMVLASAPLLYLHWFLALLGFLCGSSHILVDRISSKAKRMWRAR